jgi:GTP-binding protein
MPGTPIRLVMRGQAQKNPYRNKREKNAGALQKHLDKRKG